MTQSQFHAINCTIFLLGTAILFALGSYLFIPNALGTIYFLACALAASRSDN